MSDSKTFPIIGYNRERPCGHVELSTQMIALLEKGAAQLAPAFTQGEDGSKTLVEISMIPSGTVSPRLPDALIRLMPSFLPHRMRKGRGDALGLVVICGDCGESRDNRNVHPLRAKHTFDCAKARFEGDAVCICGNAPATPSDFPPMYGHTEINIDWLLSVLRYAAEMNWPSIDARQSWLVQRVRAFGCRLRGRVTMPAPPKYSQGSMSGGPDYKTACRSWPFRKRDHKKLLARQEKWLLDMAIAHTGKWTTITGALQELTIALDDFEEYRSICGCQKIPNCPTIPPCPPPPE